MNIGRDKLHLVYHMWIPKNFDFDNDIIFKVHYFCLKQYAHLFDSAVFYLSVDDVEDYTSVKEVEQRLISLDFNYDIEFNVVRNNPFFRECETFQDGIINKMDEIDGITFFAHNKGMTNLYKYEKNADEVIEWVLAMYYLNLNFIDEVKKFLLCGDKMYKAYGTYQMIRDEFDNVYHWAYAGTFQWLNTKGLSNYIKCTHTPIPVMADRNYAETFLGNIFPFLSRYCASHLWYTTDKTNPYKEASEITSELMTEDEYADYCKFKQECIKTIGL